MIMIILTSAGHHYCDLQHCDQHPAWPCHLDFLETAASLTFTRLSRGLLEHLTYTCNIILSTSVFPAHVTINTALLCIIQRSKFLLISRGSTDSTDASVPAKVCSAIKRSVQQHHNNHNTTATAELGRSQMVEHCNNFHGLQQPWTWSQSTLQALRCSIKNTGGNKNYQEW